MTLAARLWIAGLALAASACSLGWDIPSPGGDGADGDGGALGGDGAVGANGHVGADGGDASVGSTVGGDAASYECDPNRPCAAGLVCHYADHLCGKGTPGGRCVVPATSCTTPPKVCGCDGAIYDDACTANQAGQDLSAAGNCTPPASSGDYLCGYVFCWFPGILPAQYCRHHSAGAETTYDCPFAPTGCNSYTCAGCAMSGCGTCQPLPLGGWVFDCP